MVGNIKLKIVMQLVEKSNLYMCVFNFVSQANLKHLHIELQNQIFKTFYNQLTSFYMWRLKDENHRKGKGGLEEC